ncbi:unnamed protein product [Euphydryas editha]|uniref:Uncharacterized protein n=1 Tax=Euphydryas editha TaxID=104508 RepID=A0AAU9U233_EUPED|nr:unnamed protein product [Euphydryas editha]
MGKGKTLRSDVRNMVLKVMNIIPVDQSMKRTAMATGISERTLRNIKQEVKKLASPSSEAGASTSTEAIKLSTPRKKKARKPTLEIDDFMICAIRNIINCFYTVKKEIPTLRKILAAAKAELNFPGQKTTLWKISSKNVKRLAVFLIQKPEIAAWRASIAATAVSMRLESNRVQLEYYETASGRKKRITIRKRNRKLTRDAIRRISADDWKREINHVDRLRQQYWESDRLQELNERELIISVGADSESDTDSIFSDSESEISDVKSMDVSD